MSEEERIVFLSSILRLRPDIQWSPFSKGRQPSWVARDPVSLEYFHFSDLEKSVACLLNGRRQLGQVLALQNNPSLSEDWLFQLVTKLNKACLTIPTSRVSLGKALWRAREQRVRRSFWQRFLSPLAIRLKLFDPTAMLSRMAPLAHFLFSKPFAALCLLLGTVLGLTVLMRLLQTPESFANPFRNLTAERAIGLIAIYVVVKSIHELGHALACKKWQAECHEIGLFFLAFTPCLYCDTSDSWKLSNRWKRACIAAAGIYVELVLAVLAAGLWLVTPPDSILHLGAANVMLVCTLSTVIVNANPLLRYDGYYALSDLWGVPNLSEQSREAAQELSIGWLTQRPLPADAWDADARLLALYWLASWIYRHCILLVIVWAVWSFLDNLGLSLLGALLVVFTLSMACVAALIGWNHWIGELWRTGSIRPIRLIIVIACVAAGIGLFFKQPFDTFVTARAVTTYMDLTPLYAKQSGILEEFATAGQHLSAGSTLVRLRSPELEMELIETQGEVALLEQQARQLNLRSVDDEATVVRLGTVVEQLAKAQNRLRILQEEQAALVMTAAEDALLLAGDSRDTASLTEPTDTRRLAPRLDSENTGCWVERGELLGWTSPADRFKLTALVTEHDAKLLQTGMGVRCRWDCDSATLYEGKIHRIAPEPVAEIHELLLGDESIPWRADRSGKLVPEQPHYEIEIQLVTQPPGIAHRTLATVHFETVPRTLYQSLQRLWDRHIRPEL